MRTGGGGGSELTNQQFENDMIAARQMPFWCDNNYQFNKCKSYTAFHCRSAHDFFKSAGEGFTFATWKDLQTKVVSRMNELFNQNCFRLINTEKYIKIKCA
mmetsp:Transcript_32858/g.43324  ORF Transcript_32858/g.43324 Transcript_32858/m.43324 type:complete len:101 (-) Transcript_32858:146-448(-)